MRRSLRPGYLAVIAGCFVAGTLLGWTALAAQVDNYVYDQMFRFFERPGPDPQSVVLGIDEATLREMGGTAHLRSMVSEALEQLAIAKPRVVGVDVILADKTDEAVDARLEAAIGTVPNLVLSCDILPTGWEDPLPRFQSRAGAIGHVHPGVNRLDGVNRILPLEMTMNGVRRWALALEAFRLWKGAPILESPDDLEIGGVTLPAPRASQRALRIRYLPQGIPILSLSELKKNPSQAEKLKGKAVFVGVTALTAARDRVVSPFGEYLPGVEVHAHAFETMLRGQFLTPVSNLSQLGIGLMLAIAVGFVFALRSGWQAWSLAAFLLVIAHTIPVVLFRNGVLSPYFAPVSAAWLTVVGAASYQYFVVRRQLRQSEADKSRYQEAIHFVAHEMRSPLTAIQGSSEMMSRYNMGDDKRKQMAQMINAESKRLARMIQTFLDVERLSEGEMEIKDEPFEADALVRTCFDRARPLADRKQIVLHYAEPVEATLAGDRELMEYAFYNLITNAIKYSPVETQVWIASERRGGDLRLSVRDQGIGMDAKEIRQIFTKFYRTKRAEQSGEAGTGIGLSIVDQIVRLHGGRMEVESEPGVGSCFTMVLTRVTPNESGQIQPSSIANRQS
ncbi:MAG: CHASE2 domain-containing protein [Bryobacteraceae bacterium]